MCVSTVVIGVLAVLARRTTRSATVIWVLARRTMQSLSVGCGRAVMVVRPRSSVISLRPGWGAVKLWAGGGRALLVVSVGVASWS